MEGATTQEATVNNPSTSGRGQRHRRQGGSRRPPPTQGDNTLPVRSAAGRPFVGRLTRLHPEAPAFVPASIAPISPSISPSKSSRPPPNRHNNRAKPPSQAQHQPQGPRDSLARSSAPDIATRIHEDISHNVYECAICTNEVGRTSKVWSCRTCWTVFHIGCIKRWSKNEGSAVQRSATQSDEDAVAAGKLWRCPGCNLPKDVHPSAYTCWCDKEIDPKSITGLPPHSCGQTCGRERELPKTCPHPCDLLCHAGPCPPCSATGPKQSCYCGKEETTRRCVETNYEAGWSCGAVCGDTMP